MIRIRPIQWLCFLSICWLHFALLADQTDDRLDGLFDTLKTSQDDGELNQTEADIWDIWYRSGDAKIDALMLDAAGWAQRGNLATAEKIYSRVIERMPGFSEGWNRRATVRFYQRDYEGSLDDIEQTLQLEPRHFGAIWGLGMILGLQRNYQQAILAFERLLEIKPNANDAKPRIEMWKQEMAKQAV